MVASSSTQPQEDGNRRVRFADTPSKVIAFTDHSLMTDEERKQTWYTQRDFDAICMDRRESVRVARRRRLQQSLLDGDYSSIEHHHFCLRGLEDLTSRRWHYERKLKRRTSIEIVLQEQKRQQRLGIKDPDAIQFVSIMSTQWSRDRALALAAGDVNHVSSYCCCNDEIEQQPHLLAPQKRKIVLDTGHLNEWEAPRHSKACCKDEEGKEEEKRQESRLVGGVRMPLNRRTTAAA